MVRFSTMVVSELTRFFELNPKPSKDEFMALAIATGLDVFRIKRWFRSKLRSLENLSVASGEDFQNAVKHRVRRGRARFLPAQRQVLMHHLEQEPYPSVEAMTEMARELGVTGAQVHNWFNNNRYRWWSDVATRRNRHGSWDSVDLNSGPAEKRCDPDWPHSQPEVDRSSMAVSNAPSDEEFEADSLVVKDVTMNREVLLRNIEENAETEPALSRSASLIDVVTADEQQSEPRRASVDEASLEEPPQWLEAFFVRVEQTFRQQIRHEMTILFHQLQQELVNLFGHGTVNPSVDIARWTRLREMARQLLNSIPIPSAAHLESSSLLNSAFPSDFSYSR